MSQNLDSMQSPQGAKPTPIEKRRKYIPDSDDVTGVIYIEQYIYRRNRYRYVLRFRIRR